MKYEIGDFIVTLCDGLWHKKRSSGIILYSLGEGKYIIKIFEGNFKTVIHQNHFEHDKTVGTKLWEALS